MPSARSDLVERVYVPSKRTRFAFLGYRDWLESIDALIERYARGEPLPEPMHTPDFWWRQHEIFMRQHRVQEEPLLIDLGGEG